MERCGFFDAYLAGEDYDRVYQAQHFAAYFASFINNGVFAQYADQLQVMAMPTPAMQVTVREGQGWINGYWYENTDELYLPIEVADGVLHRIDSVVLRFGTVERNMWIAVKKGVPTVTNPVPPELTRDADYYELQLALISIPASSISVTQARITDTRLDTSVCGWVTGVVDQIDTTTLFAQFEAYFQEFKDTYEADYDSWTTEQKGEYDTWFAGIQDILDENAAATLLDLINTTNANLTAEIAAVSGTLTGNLNAHTADTTIHPSPAKQTTWDGKATTATYTATISTSWSGSGPYTQNITVSGLLSTDNPIVGPVLSATLATRQAQQEAWNMVSRITASANALALTCDDDKPTTAIPIQIKVVR